MLPILVALAALTLPRNQQPDPALPPELRAPALGEVRDAGGQPWTAAEVVLLSRPLPHDANCGEVDRVVAKVDERGRFHAAILRGRPYSAWAWGPAKPTGRPASAVAERVFAQQPIVLQQARVLPAREIVLEHAERWDGFTFRVRIVDELGNRDVHWLDVADGRAPLPWLVAGTGWLELFAVQDGVLHPLSRLALAADAAAQQRVEVAEHKRITCFARDTRDAPLAGATVFRRIGDALHPVGTTDAAGSLALDVGVPSSPDVATFVQAAGSIGVFVSPAIARIPAADAPPGVGPDDLFCRFETVDPVYARFIDCDGKPQVGLEVLHSGNATCRPTRSSMSWSVWSTTARTGPDGTVALCDGDGAHALLRERELAALPRAWRQGVVPVVFAPLCAATGRGTKQDPFVVTPSQLCPIELSFTGPGSTPLANVDVALVTLGEGRVGFWPSWNDGGAMTDERGRIRLLVPSGRLLGVSATAGMSMLIRAIETTSGRLDAGPATASFAMPAPCGIRGRLHTANGDAAAGLSIDAWFGTANVPAEWDYEGQPADVLANTAGNALRIVLPEQNDQRLRLTCLISRPVTTDAEGRFALPLPAVAIPGLLLFEHGRDVRFAGNKRRVTWTGVTIDDLDWRIDR